MKILVITDKFKKTLSSQSIGKLIQKELKNKNHDVDYVPISDGGDGFLFSININKNFKRKYCYVLDAYLNKKKTYYLYNGDIAYIEVAKIIGVSCIENEKDIYKASSYGVGQIIKKAILNGIHHFYIGLGGTITNDGGKGLLEALGYVFLENKIENKSNIDYCKISFDIISDVTNPLLNETGATYIFAKQKGALAQDLPILEQRMKEYADLVNEYCHTDYTNKVGSGAAGGLGFAFYSFFNATYHLGIDYMIDYHNLENIISKYDLIITGEGKIDNQSLNGKIVFKIASLTKKPTIMVCGINELTNKQIYKDIYSIVPTIADYETAIKYPSKCLKKLINNININDYINMS